MREVIGFIGVVRIISLVENDLGSFVILGFMVDIFIIIFLFRDYELYFLEENLN